MLSMKVIVSEEKQFNSTTCTAASTTVELPFFQMNPDQPVLPQVSSSSFSRREPLGSSGTCFLQVGCPSCHQTISVILLNGTQSTNPNHWTADGHYCF